MDDKTAELAIIIPVYNEEKAIENVLEKWSSELEHLGICYQIHVYNDGSKDNTSAVLAEQANRCAQIIIHDKENSGHGPTILQGYQENSDKPWIFQVDSDDEISPHYFHELWERRDEFDFLIGNRKERESPLSRKIVSFVSRLTVRILYGTGVYDVNSPYRLMRTDVFKDYFSAVPSDTFAPNVIISGIACLKKFRTYQIPVSHSFRRTGEVSIKKAVLLKAAVESFIQTVCFRFSSCL